MRQFFNGPTRRPRGKVDKPDTMQPMRALRHVVRRRALHIERRAKLILNKQSNLQNIQMHKTRVYKGAQDLTGEYSEK